MILDFYHKKLEKMKVGKIPGRQEKTNVKISEIENRQTIEIKKKKAVLGEEQ